MAKLLYKPFGILFSVLGGILAGAAFKQVWKRVAGQEDSPKAKESEYGWKEILPAAAIQGAIFGSSRPSWTAAAPKASASSPAPGRATDPKRAPWSLFHAQ